MKDVTFTKEDIIRINIKIAEDMLREASFTRNYERMIKSLIVAHNRIESVFQICGLKNKEIRFGKNNFKDSKKKDGRKS